MDRAHPVDGPAVDGEPAVAGAPAVGGDLPAGTRFIGPDAGSVAAWFPGREAPADADLASCVACGLCLPHCPTYRLTGEESASPRGRIAAMREVADGRGVVDDTFASFMDLCLSCRACEDVCPSHVPFGRMMEAAREQVEPLRSRRARLVRWLGLEVALPRRKLLWLAAALQPLARPFLPRRVRAMVPPRSALFHRLPAVTPAVGEERGTVAMLSGCVQDRWFREVNLATIRVLSRNGWRVTVPRSQVCCGALSAHNGRLKTARALAKRNARAFTGADHVIVNAAGCGAHMADAIGDEALPVRDLMSFLAEEGLREPTEAGLSGGGAATGAASSTGAAAHDRRVPRRMSRPACPEGARPAARAVGRHPGARGRRPRARRSVLRRGGSVQRDTARDVGRAATTEGRGGRGQRRRDRRERESRLHDAAGGRPARTGPRRRGRPPRATLGPCILVAR